MADRRCSIEGCDNPHRARGYCSTHWRRWRIHGDPHHVTEREPLNHLCSVEGCEKRHSGHGFCVMHLARWHKHGDIDRVDPGGYTHPRGEDNPKWQGDDISYGGMHDRLARLRERPAVCEHCGVSGPTQWALSWETATDIRVEERHRRGKVDRVPFSVRLDDYIALCRSCHRRYDLERPEAWLINFVG